MPSAERIQQLNQEIHSNLEQAVSTLRRTLLDRLQASAQNLAQDLVHRVEEIQAHLPSGPWVQQDAFGDEAREAESQGAAAAAASLRDGLKSLDAARTQAEVLNALLREARRFASRAAVVLNRGSEVRGWAASGFQGGDGDPGERSLREQTFHFSSHGAWGRLSDGAVPLAAAECAELCSRLESALPQEGVLIPIVLRDRLAAALYADREEGGTLQVEGLQVLAFVASQVIETLPFRERATTATLQSAGGAVERAAAPAAPDPEPAPAAAAEAAPAAASDPEPAPEPEVAAEPEAAAAPEVPEAPTLGLDDTAPGINAGWTVEDDDTPAAAAPELAATAPLAASETRSETWVEEPEPEAEPAPVPARTAGFEPPAPAAETVLLQRPTPVPAPAPITATFPVPRLEPPAPPAAPEPAAPAAPAAFAPEPGGRSLGSTAEVAPPTDVQGPGWAFATTRVAVSPDDEMAHEEARRLARLLVSEIKLYNEEQVEEGRRNRDVYERLKEDIDRSRQMYEERVEPRILKSTDYFYQELVRILASGDARTLGI